MRTIPSLAGAAVAAVAVLWFVGETHPPTSSAIQGDTLGMIRGETKEDYQRRAQASLAIAGSDPVFALVSFTEPTSALRAADAVEGVERVNGVVEKQKPLVAVPEPTAGRSRADVFEAVAEGPIEALVVFAPGDALRDVATQEQVFTVEALPPDAVWGAFAVVNVD